MKKAILFLFLLLLVAGGTVGALYFLRLGPFQEKVENPQEKEEAHEEETTSLVKIKSFSIPLFQGERIASNIEIQFELEVKKGHEAHVEERMTRLEDAYLRDLYVFLPRLMRNKDTLDIYALKKRLIRVSKKILNTEESGNIVTDILIQTVADSPR